MIANPYAVFRIFWNACHFTQFSCLHKLAYRLVRDHIIKMNTKAVYLDKLFSFYGIQVGVNDRHMDSKKKGKNFEGDLLMENKSCWLQHRLTVRP